MYSVVSYLIDIIFKYSILIRSHLQENDEYNLTIYATDKQESTYVQSRLIATSVPNETTSDSVRLNPIVLEQNPIYVFEVSTRD